MLKSRKLLDEAAMTPDEKQIRELHATWIDAVNAGNLPQLLAS